jgi:hypothetical protein
MSSAIDSFSDIPFPSISPSLMRSPSNLEQVREVLCVASLVACSKWFTALSLARVPLSSQGGVKILFNAIAANTVRYA